MLVASPVKPIFSVQNCFRGIILISKHWMAVDCLDLTGIDSFSSSSMQILYRHSGFQKKSFRQPKWTRTIIFSVWAQFWTISSVSQMYPTSVICLFRPGGSSCLTYRFWLPCHISNMQWALAIVGNFLSSTALFNFELFTGFVASNAGLSPMWFPLLARTHCHTTTFLAMGLPSGCSQPVNSNISYKGITGLHSDTIWYDIEYSACHIWVLSVLWVPYTWLVTPVSDVW